MSTEAEGTLSNREKMLRGIPYHPGDPELLAGRYRAMKYTKAYNVSFFSRSPIIKSTSAVTCLCLCDC